MTLEVVGSSPTVYPIAIKMQNFFFFSIINLNKSQQPLLTKFNLYYKNHLKFFIYYNKLGTVNLNTIQKYFIYINFYFNKQLNTIYHTFLYSIYKNNLFKKNLILKTSTITNLNFYSILSTTNTNLRLFFFLHSFIKKDEIKKNRKLVYSLSGGTFLKQNNIERKSSRNSFFLTSTLKF